MKRRGFTLVELMVVIVVMAILLTLAVVNVNSTQIKARDNERHTDAENIAKIIESTHEMVDSTKTYKTYPSVTIVKYWMDHDTESNMLTDRINVETLRAPNVDKESPPSLITATNNIQTSTGVRPLPTTSTYVYQAVTNDNAICVLGAAYCAKFSIFYRLERPTDDCPAPDNICVIRSKRQ